MILVLGSFYFTLTEDDPSARIILDPCKWGLSFHASSQSSYKTLSYPRVQQQVVQQQSSRSAKHARALYLISPCTWIILNSCILWNRVQYRHIFSRQCRRLRRYPARSSRIIVLLFNKLSTKNVLHQEITCMVMHMRRSTRCSYNLQNNHQRHMSRSSHFELAKIISARESSILFLFYSRFLSCFLKAGKNFCQHGVVVVKLNPDGNGNEDVAIEISTCRLTST